FAYRAQSLDGQPLSGTIDAASADQARERLESLRLRVLELGPATPAAAAPGVRALRGDDFITFNQQLAHLTAAGLPMEQGLRRICGAGEWRRRCARSLTIWKRASRSAKPFKNIRRASPLLTGG